ncbi:cation:dicarboxylase symporter family transporter [Methylobacterium currus]|nr:cation:dicarboxylase symporter family transporter [Methylobacterium currus]UHC19847.1 cation:dicarboxylase symporter family transporter [Methylobacterium currus]
MNRISDAFLEFIHLIMWVAPIGTFGAVAFAVGSSGTSVLLALIDLILSFCAVVILFIVVVLRRDLGAVHDQPVPVPRFHPRGDLRRARHRLPRS